MGGVINRVSDSHIIIYYSRAYSTPSKKETPFSETPTPFQKSGGLDLVSFDWSRFKLFTLKFSKESLQTPSSVRDLKLFREACFCHLK